VIHGQIVRPCRRAKCNRGKVGLRAAVTGPRDELDDLRTHENPSHTAIATRPASESDIKYAVMLSPCPCVNQMCGMVAYQATISGANPIPGAICMADRRGGAACGRGRGPRRAPARSRVPANEGSDGNALARRLATMRGGMWRPELRSPSDSKSPRPISLAAGSKILAMMSICR